MMGCATVRARQWVNAMLATKAERAPDDQTRVGLDEAWEVRFWCAKFNVTPRELRACVLEVGPRTQDIEARLRKARRESFSKGGED